MTTSTGQVRRRALYNWLLRSAIGLISLAVAISTREPLIVIPAFLLSRRVSRMSLVLDCRAD